MNKTHFHNNFHLFYIKNILLYTSWYKVNRIITYFVVLNLVRYFVLYILINNLNVINK